MDIVVDTSALVAVILAEPERDAVVRLTHGHNLIGPGSIPWEAANAFSGMLKQRRLGLDAARRAMAILEAVPLRFVEVDLANVLNIAHGSSLYVYDACFLDCAIRYAAPLMTLDRTLKRAARSLSIQVLEV